LQLITKEEILIATTEKLQLWIEQFERFHRESGTPGWLRRLQQEAFARFCELGFPTFKDEDWRFTSVQPIANTAFQLALGLPASYEFNLELLEGLACRLVFVNGRFAPELSETGNLPKGAVATGLKAAIERDGAYIQSHLARYEDFQADSFTALNTAFIADGAFVRLPRGTVLEQPIYVLYVSTGSDHPQMVHPRNLIVCEEDSQASIVEDYVSVGAADAGVHNLSNVVTELLVGDNGVVSHYMVEREERDAFNISTLRIQQGRSASVASHSFLLGGGLVRNNVHPVLAGEGGECLINGLFIGIGRQHLDNYMKVEHQAPHCGSRQFYNGILDEHARGVFHGRIIVHKDAQKTDAKQTNRNLLLSDTAQIDTKPQLEIYADDVKCTHGATIGQIDETALFYLRSRGLPEAEAHALLLYAFAHENLGRVKAGVVRTWLEGLVNAWLPRSRGRQIAAQSSGAEDRSEGSNWQEVG
jgi:Fe-S cluster assembly protein SufD